MLPQQRNEMVIEDAIERVRKVLNAAENSNQAGEDLIVVMATAPTLFAALEEVAKGEGAFSRDPLTHAASCIENMREIARAALSKTGADQ